MEKNVKVYFEDNDEIRRFLLRAPSQAELFKQLNDNISSFWAASGGTFHILYKDEENDFIKLSTPQEFEVCMTCPSNREILRIFVRKNDAASPATGAATQATNKAIWKHVTCDKCTQFPLQGIRYKCTVCPDYDECSKCFGSTPQHPHSMLAITDPNSDEWKACLRRGARHHFGHGGPGGPLHAPHHHGMVRGLHGRRCERGPGAFPLGGGGEGGPYPWMRAMQDVLGNKLGGMAATGPCGASASAAAQGTMPTSGVSYSTCEGGHPKVEVDVDMNELLNQPENVFSTVCRAVEGVGKMFQSMAAPQQPFQQQASTSSQTVQAATQDKKEGTRDAVQQDVEMGDSAAVVVDVATVSTAVEQQPEMKATSSSASLSAGTQTPPLRKKTPAPETAAPLGWTLLSDAKSTEQVRQKETEDMIRACIESLKDLGFDTDKSWMRSLVGQCEGNLSRVMDELTPGANLRF